MTDKDDYYIRKVAKADEDSWLLFRCAAFFVFVVILYKLFKYFI